MNTGENMNRSYQLVVENKNRKVIDTVNFTCDLDTAKKLLHVLMYQTGVRYGYVLQKASGLLKSIISDKKVYEDVIIHEGE